MTPANKRLLTTSEHMRSLAAPVFSGQTKVE